MAYDIFISYRRRGGFETAKHLYDLLTKDGYRVSFDIDTLRNGDFDTELLRRIDECRDFILILSEGGARPLRRSFGRSVGGLGAVRTGLCARKEQKYRPDHAGRIHGFSRQSA